MNKQKALPMKKKCASHKDSEIDISSFSAPCRGYAMGCRALHAKEPHRSSLKGVKIAMRQRKKPAEAGTPAEAPASGEAQPTLALSGA